jgi:hypothetical protein
LRAVTKNPLILHTQENFPAIQKAREQKRDQQAADIDH